MSPPRRPKTSQPALSRQIHDLEEELGFSLFERSAKSVRLTEAGKSFLIESRAVLQRTEEAVNTARAVATGGGSEFHISYAPSPTVRILPPTLRAFQARFPKVRVKLHDLSSEEMLLGVREGSLELAIMVRPNRAALRRLHFEELTREAMCLAVPPEHSMTRLRSIPLAKAAQGPLVGFSRKEYPDYSDYLEVLFGPLKTKPTIAQEHDSAASLVAAIESGAGVAIVPENFACSTGTRLKFLPLTPAPEPLVVGGVWLKDGLSSTAEGFWKLAQDSVSKLR